MKTSRRNLLKSLFCAGVMGASVAVGSIPKRLRRAEWVPTGPWGTNKGLIYGWRDRDTGAWLHDGEVTREEVLLANADILIERGESDLAIELACAELGDNNVYYREWLRERRNQIC